uniref:M56 family metallopeptidase n=1 Tax=uncultured Polaribacter sp. TaxID=174711 RepID=UPI002624DC9B|nr:M56 family metallopeptidase [uncultured Polaribacter sp.]
MISYLLKSAACLALILFFYHLILEKEKMHHFNRFYLLIGVVFSFVIPFASITIDVEPIVIQATESTYLPVLENNNNAVIIEQNNIDYLSIIIGVYVFVSLLFLIRFGINLYKIIRKIYLNKKISYQKAVLVLVDDKILPHTFWNYIFINKEAYFNEKVEQELFTHELTHATQKHTIDVLLIELLQVVFWINPLFIFLKKAIQLNHEYLADETVITKHKNTFQYQHLLINKASWKNDYYLASNLNYLVTKKRLKMMTIQSSPTKILLKKLAVIPLLAGFFFLFAERVEAQEVIVEEKEIPIETITEKIADNQLDYSNNKLYKEYIYSKGRYTFKNKNGKSITKKYNELTQEEKKSLVPPPPLKTKKKIPTSKLIKELKNSEKYALWINGKVAKNSDLNKYNKTDFSHYFISFIHKNARSKRFPQEYQASLETKQYFKSKTQKRVNDFLKYLKEKHGIEEVEEEVKPKVIEVKENKKKYNLPSSNGSKQSYLEKPILINSLKTGFKEINGNIFYYVITRGKTKFYNKKGFLVNEKGKEISSKKANASEIIPDNYVKKVFYKNKLFCEFKDDNPNTGFTNDINIEELKDNKLEKYLKANYAYEAVRNSKPHYVNSLSKRQKHLENLFSELGSLYFRLSKENKSKVKRPIHPQEPYVRLMKNDVVFYKLRKDLTEEDKLLFPPPPVPMNASEEEKQKAKMEFENWKKRTGNTLNEIPPAPKKSKKPKKEIIKSKNVKSALKVKDTIPEKKVKPKITFNSSKTLKEESFVNALKNLTEEEKKKNRENVSYFLDGKKITYKQLSNVETNKIKSINIRKLKDGSKIVEAKSK